MTLDIAETIALFTLLVGCVPGLYWLHNTAKHRQWLPFARRCHRIESAPNPLLPLTNNPLHSQSNRPASPSPLDTIATAGLGGFASGMYSTAPQGSTSVLEHLISPPPPARLAPVRNSSKIPITASLSFQKSPNICAQQDSLGTCPSQSTHLSTGHEQPSREEFGVVAAATPSPRPHPLRPNPDTLHPGRDTNRT
ncbi:uncharacterized protein B0I36DRAFT_355373 [Microdochium trichocladiopsis]|uniref:Uncharacterized protein n=1 Tax=Microdochium trichocladiopsis TaxID=1682393 RepID=A0A9P8XT45_9PEZI|nr:uncharacterized protein B0I36DRAFT_355373 [Microdochium trichocladiopsis]KAH7014106.1 hypothetical protein B0I36DRAFT_355373 [Microdochium trichocladiopsis]